MLKRAIDFALLVVINFSLTVNSNFEKYDETDLTRIEYNLTDKSFGEHYGEKHQATTEDKNFVIKSLDEYINLARNIVAKNISCKSNDKKLVLKK